MATTNDPIFVFQNQTSDLTTGAFYLDFANKVVVQVHGTWGGATLKLQQGIITGTGGTAVWVDINDKINIPYDFTENDVLTLTDFIYNQPLRGVLTGSTGTTNLTCTLQVVIGAS